MASARERSPRGRGDGLIETNSQLIGMHMTERPPRVFISRAPEIGHAPDRVWALARACEARASMPGSTASATGRKEAGNSG